MTAAMNALMSGGLELAFVLLGGLLAIPAGTVCAQVLLARLMPERAAGQPARSDARPSVAVIIPAHNESRVIAKMLYSVQAQLQPGDRLLVVADNCSDDTAAVVQALRVDVAVRTSLQRGKGYALDFGVRGLGRKLPEVLIFIDADCIAEPGTIEQLARQAVETGRPAQAYSHMRAAPGSGSNSGRSTGKKIAEFAWVVRNFVRPLGWRRIGLPCQLMGTGMAFPRALVPRLTLANGHIVEDMRLGVDLAIAGYQASFCPTAEVTSLFPEAREDTAIQRTRWEHGHLGMIFSGVPRLLFTALRQRSASLLAMALDLAVPPLALLTLVACGLGVAGALAMGLLGPITLVLSMLPAALLALSVLLAWDGWGRKLISSRDLLKVGGYIAGKIPIYFRFIVKREIAWIKTRRD